ncbi:paeninodin family lasso peptide [Aliikangiella sp. IMCC44359]
MKKEDQEITTENNLTNKDVWQKPELSILDVEKTKGGAGIADEDTTNYAS